MKTYEIKHDDKTVGSAKITVEGLYYKVCCQCTLSKPALYRIYAATENSTVDLGICVPSGNQYSLVKRIPIHQLTCENASFSVSERKKDESLQRFAIEEGQPFMHIDKLEHSHIEYHSGRPYLVMTDATNRQ